MRPFFLALFSYLFLATSCQEQKPPPPSIDEVVKESLNFCVAQAKILADSLKDQPDLLPIAADWNGKIRTAHSDWWTTGFFPGELWYLYEYSGDLQLKEMAELYTARVEKEQYTTNNHDVGFLIYCSVGNQYRLRGGQDDRLKQILITTAESLCTRYRPGAKTLQSWDLWEETKALGWQCPVIIDNMMNLELLEQATLLSGNPRYAQIARNHANTTLKNHFRSDYSCFHVVDYDPRSGEVRHKKTWQGYSDQSAWARGQAWGLYGYTMMFREVGDSAYLEQALHIADFILSKLPEDKIPYWDFDAPNIPDAFRDVSAGAITCSGLLELSRYAPQEKKELYLAVAEQQLRSLATPYYRSAVNGNGGMILKHSVGSLPSGSEVDVPLIYADYYYVEALMRHRNWYGAPQ